jgi:hypothetical protein
MPDNYFNYFTEVEERYQQRRGGALLLSTLDWALIEMWKDAGIPLEAVLRGIDATFDKWEQCPRKTRKVNSLAYCAQEVMAAAEDLKEAATGAAARDSAPTGLGPEEIRAYLEHNARALEEAPAPPAATDVIRETAAALRALAEAAGGDLEGLERRLTVLEERLFAALHAATSAEELMTVRSEADRDLAPYRAKMTAPQIEQLHRQYVHKRLLERARLPRLSLFYL